MFNRKFSLAKALALTCFILAAAQADAVEPAKGEEVNLPNISFAEGPQNWMLRDAPELDNIYRASKTPEGLTALSIVLDDKSPDRLKAAAYIARRDLPVTAGYYYQLQFKMSSDLTSGNAGVRVIAEKKDGSQQILILPGDNGAPLTAKKSPWTDYVLLYRVPENTQTVVLQYESLEARGSVSVAGTKLTRLDGEAAKDAQLQLQPKAKTATEFGAYLVGTPCRVINAIGKKLIYQPPGLDHPILVLNSCTTGRLGSAIFVDYVKGTSTVIPMPSGSGGWDVIETSPGKLLFESLGPLSLVTIDTTGGNYRVESNISVPQSEYAWNFAKSPQGEIYFGSYPTGHVHKYTPGTGKIEDLGYFGPKGNLYARFLGFDDRGYLLVFMGLSKNNIIAYNVATKEQTIVAPGVGTALITVGGRVYASIAGVLNQFDAPSMKFIPAQLTPAPRNMTWHTMSPNSTPERYLIMAADSKWYEVVSNQEPKQVFGLDLRGGSVVGQSDDNKVVVFRGQEYAVVSSGATDVQWRQVTDKAIPVSMHFITADPKGGVTGGPTFGQTLFRFDPARKLEQNTGQVVDGGGEVYDGLWLGDDFHFVAYSGGYQAKWNPEKPWEQWHNENPRTLVEYNKADYGNLVRPIGKICIGPGNKLYTGWSGAYGKADGALTEYDPATNKSRRWSNSLFDEAASIGKVVSDGKYIYGLTSNNFNGIAPKAKPIFFWVFDPQTEKVLFKKQLEVTAGANLLHIPTTNRIWLALPDGLHQISQEKFDYAQTLWWPREVGRPGDVNSVSSLGSTGWLSASNTVIKLEDGAKPKLTGLFKVESAAHIAAGYDGKLYFTQQDELWTVDLQK